MSESDLQSTVPLVVDLDGTLVATDTLIENLLAVILPKPWIVFLLPFWLLRGKAVLKRRLAEAVAIDAALLPYRQSLLTRLREEHGRGRALYLASAADERIVHDVAQHLGIFRQAWGSDGVVNLSGRRKADKLRAALGPKAFEYAGDSRKDLPVWEQSGGAWVVGGAALSKRASRVTRVTVDMAPQGFNVWRLAKLIRVHQWVKNLLVFVPILVGHRFRELETITVGLQAFACFSLCASSAYVLNDMLDLESDRAHPRKRSRPLANGDVPLGLAAVMVILLLGGAFALSALSMGGDFTLILGAYLATTLAYSIVLKRLVLIDVMVLAGLYTLRMFGGSVATGIPISHWLLTFSMFAFVSLALVKRFSEAKVMRDSRKVKMGGRGYKADDLEQLASLGSASGYVAILVLALYITSPEVSRLYHRPQALWILCVALWYWLSRTWLLAHRGEMHDDPIVFALKDRVSHLIAGAALLLIWLAT